jgi:putative peptidoglycan lipid II flippase
MSLAVDTVIGTYLPEKSVSLMYYADRINQLPLGVLGTAVSTALLPLMARQISAGKADEAVGSLNRAIEYAMLLTLPAAAALSIIADPILQVLFVGGKFTHEDASLSAQSLSAYAAGLPAFVLIKVLGPGFFARGDMGTPVRIGMGILVLNLALSLALMHPLRHVGPPLATTLAMTVNVVLLAVLLRRRDFWVPDRLLWSRLARMGVATAVMAGLLWVARRRLVPDMGGHVPVGVLAVLVGLGLAAYGLSAACLGLLSVGETLGRIRRKLRGAAPAAIADPPA